MGHRAQLQDDGLLIILPHMVIASLESRSPMRRAGGRQKDARFELGHRTLLVVTVLSS